jgi:hypothetical protein
LEKIPFWRRCDRSRLKLSFRFGSRSPAWPPPPRPRSHQEPPRIGRLRSYEAAGTFIEPLMRFKGDREDYAAGIAAHVIRRWPSRENRLWFVRTMETAGEMIEDNVKMKVPLLEFPRTTVRKLKAAGEK